MRVTKIGAALFNRPAPIIRGVLAVESPQQSENVVLDAILEHVDPGISMVDADLSFVAFNSKFVELFELPASFKIGSTMSDFIRHNAERGLYGEVDIEQTVAELVHPDRHFKARELERTLADGTVLQIRVIPVASGGQVSTYTDVTEVRKTERALRESEALFKSVLDNLPAVVFLRSPDGRFKLINRHYEETYGVKHENVLGKTLYDIYPKDQADKFNALDQQAIAA